MNQQRRPAVAAVPPVYPTMSGPAAARCRPRSGPSRLPGWRVPTQGAAALAAGAAGGQGPVGVVDDPEVGRRSGGAADAGGAVSAPATAGVQAGGPRAAGVRWQLGGAAEATGSGGREGFWVGKVHPVLQ